MFLDNKYSKWYNQIIQRAQTRTMVGYSEEHHIIPKSLGGTNLVENLVELTAREHFICHLLLTKMVEGSYKYKMIKAARMMGFAHGNGQQRYKTTSRIYESLKRAITVPDEVRQKMGVSQRLRFENEPGTFLGRKHSADTRMKMSQSASKPKSIAWKESASKNRKGKTAPNLGIAHTEETKKKISAAMTGEKNGFFGKHHSEEQRQKKREEKLNAPKKECQHCGKLIDSMNFNRWHGDKCKMKGTI